MIALIVENKCNVLNLKFYLIKEHFKLIDLLIYLRFQMKYFNLFNLSHIMAFLDKNL